MRCAWSSFISLLPQWMRSDVDKYGKQSLQELRLRLHRPPELITKENSILLNRAVCLDDLNFCVNTASRYSPWSAWTSRFGYITAPGGHRIGLCGNAIVKDQQMTGISAVTSLCLRVARDFEGIARCAPMEGSVLILGKPGWGKTTLLRDLIRMRSDLGQAGISVVDEKREIFPGTDNTLCFPPGKRTDIITSCSKAQGIEAVLRNMGPGAIAVDEITSQTDTQALLNAAWCGVCLLATAHAGSKAEFMKRNVYRPLVDAGVFDVLLVLRQDKSWYTERMYVIAKCRFRCIYLAHDGKHRYRYPYPARTCCSCW